MNPHGVLQRFLEEPGGHIILDSDLKVLDVGPEYLRMTKSHREDILGKLYINTLTEPDPKRHEQAVDTCRRLTAAAIKTHDSQNYNQIRSDIRDPSTGTVEERWWSGAYIPVVENDRVEYIVHRIEDITLNVVLVRRMDAQRKRNYILYTVNLIALIMSVWALGVYATGNRASIQNVCSQVQSVNGNLYKTILHQKVEIASGQGEIGKFYRHNPGLQAAALTEADRELKIFSPKKC